LAYYLIRGKILSTRKKTAITGEFGIMKQKWQKYEVRGEKISPKTHLNIGPNI